MWISEKKARKEEESPRRNTTSVKRREAENKTRGNIRYCKASVHFKFIIMKSTPFIQTKYLVTEQRIL